MAVDSETLLPNSASPGRARRALSWIGRTAPQGNRLPLENWIRRHRVIVFVLWAHVAALPFYGIANGHGLEHSLLETAAVALFASAATVGSWSRSIRSVAATIGLVSSSAILTHFSGGLIEMHFHFFVVVAIVTLYQSWLPFAVAIVYVLVHHGLAGAIDPGSVYNHASAVANPWKWALVHAAFIAGESAACLTAWKLNEDALQGERRVRLALEKANRDLGDAQQLARIGSWEWVPSTDAVWWSDELYRIFGLDPKTETPSLETFFALLHPDDRAPLQELMESIRAGASGDVGLEVRIARTDGEQRILHCLGEGEQDERGVYRVMGTCQDVTEQKQLEAEVEYTAFHDGLTGLSNRALFVDRSLHALETRRSHGLVSVLFVDLDDFKTVNDSLGPAIGDEFLIEVSKRLQAVLRPADTIARLGSDEFAILLENADVRIATQVAGRVQESLRRPLRVGDHQTMVHASIGIAISERDSTPESMLRDADIAMYAAKSGGKNAARVCDADMRISVVRRQQLKAELQDAIKNEQFVVHLQPICSLETEEFVAAEALVRWEHPQWGLIPPVEFIGLAEETGLIVQLGAWILSEATKSAKSLQEELGRFAISVNLSATQLQNSDIVGTVKGALEASGLAPEDLILEITETVVAGENESTVDALKEMRSLGIKIAIDDFGTGYSTLSYLYRFPLDVLKIDREFVSTLANGPDELAVVQALIELASVLKLRTVAEGIETRDQLDKLKELGCKNGQGYLFSRPLDRDSFLAWAQEHSAGTGSELARATV